MECLHWENKTAIIIIYSHFFKDKYIFIIILTMQKQSIVLLIIVTHFRLKTFSAFSEHIF